MIILVISSQYQDNKSRKLVVRSYCIQSHKLTVYLFKVGLECMLWYELDRYKKSGCFFNNKILHLGTFTLLSSLQLITMDAWSQERSINPPQNAKWVQSDYHSSHNNATGDNSRVLSRKTPHNLHSLGPYLEAKAGMKKEYNTQCHAPLQPFNILHCPAQAPSLNSPWQLSSPPFFPPARRTPFALTRDPFLF